MKDTPFLLAVLTAKEYGAKLAHLLEGLPHRIIESSHEKAVQELLGETRPRLAVLDMREAGSGILNAFGKVRVPVLSMDDYAAGSRQSEALLCPLPHFSAKFANFSDWIYNPMDLPPKRNGRNGKKPGARKKVLITFGGSDPKNIAYIVIRTLLEAGKDEECDIQLVEGPMCDYRWAYDISSIEMIITPPKLTEYIEKADVVFTTVGMTLMECLYLEKKIVAVNPTPYHDRIAASMKGIINLGFYKKVSRSGVVESLDAERPESAVDPSSFDYGNWFTSLAERMIANGPAACPVCGSAKREAWQRNGERTLFCCGGCGSNYLYLLRDIAKQYDEDYFKGNHQSAYGSTYIEDEKNIRDFSRRRLKTIAALAHSKKKRRLLDCGSALGLFCDEANRAGFESVGLEISSYARKFAKDNFGVEGCETFDEATGSFDAVTFWFMLEHVNDPRGWIIKARDRLKEGGILAISVPSASGLLARFNRQLYLKIRPSEHLFEPTLRGMKRLLADCGFKVRKTEIFGLHPARAGLPEWAIVKNAQKILKLGDTYEIYAEKIHS